MGGLLGKLGGSKDEYEGRTFYIHRRRYAFEKRLGKGGFGAVYKAIRQDGLPVAVKVINLEGLPPAQTVDLAKSYLNEVELLNNLRKQSRHVVKIHDFDFEPRSGKGFIVMELGNENLSALIEGLRSLSGGYDTAIDFVMIQEFWRQIVVIIRTLHAHNIVHMDLKPDNLILFGETLKIGDLGISRKVNVPGRAGYGTMLFSAPEIMLDSGVSMRRYGPKADVWSLGAILYFMVYGVPPQYHHLAANPPPGQMPYPSEEINDALRRTLVLDPNTRADINSLVYHPLTQE